MSDLCPIAVPKDSSEDRFQPETAGESHLLLLKQKKYCDVTFTFPSLPDRIEAHEVFLKARSPEFAKLFRMRKSGNVLGNEIKINDSSPEVFQQFLEFIYADQLEVEIVGALDLLQLSQKYKVHSLTKKCEERLKNEIPVMDSIKIFETARRYGRWDLMHRAGQIMVKSFFKLVRSGALANAEEETLIYLLECDDLEVPEAGLFQFILDWGQKQVGSSGDKQLLRNKLKNLIPKIRYPNMAPDTFTKVVVPTGLLSSEETVSVYSYFCGDEDIRRGLKDQFNTTHRKAENKITVTKVLNFYAKMTGIDQWFPAFSKHCISFQADRTQVDGKVLPDYFPKTFITAIDLRWPDVHPYYICTGHVLNFNVSLAEYCGPVEEGNCTVRFQTTRFHCEQGHFDKVSLEPPVELVSGRTYSVIVEDNSSFDSIDSFRPHAYLTTCFANMKRNSSVDFEDFTLTFKDITKKTDYCKQNIPNGLGGFAMIRRIEIGLM